MSSPQMTRMFGCLPSSAPLLLALSLPRHFVCSSCHAVASYPNGPTWNTMLTIAAMPMSSRMTAVISVSDSGNLLSP